MRVASAIEVIRFCERVVRDLGCQIVNKVIINPGLYETLGLVESVRAVSCTRKYLKFRCKKKPRGTKG